MNPTLVLCHWSQKVGKGFEFLSKPQAFVLAAFSLGVTGAKSCTLSRVAQSLFMLGTVPAVLPQPGSQSEKSAVLLVDETALNEYLKVMTVALAYRGRAPPLAWWYYP